MSCASYDQHRFCKKFAHYSLSGCLWRDSTKDHICICAIRWVSGILLGLLVMAVIVGTDLRRTEKSQTYPWKMAFESTRDGKYEVYVRKVQ